MCIYTLFYGFFFSFFFFSPSPSSDARGQMTQHWKWMRWRPRHDVTGTPSPLTDKCPLHHIRQAPPPPPPPPQPPFSLLLHSSGLLPTYPPRHPSFSRDCPDVEDGIPPGRKSTNYVDCITSMFHRGIIRFWGDEQEHCAKRKCRRGCGHSE